MTKNTNERLQILKLKSGRYAVISCWEVDMGKFCHPTYGNIEEKFNTLLEAQEYINDNSFE